MDTAQSLTQSLTALDPVANTPGAGVPVPSPSERARPPWEDPVDEDGATGPADMIAGPEPGPEPAQADAAPPPEPAAEPEPEPAKDPVAEEREKRSAKAFAALARRETEVQRKEAAFRQQVATYHEQLAKLESERKAWQAERENEESIASLLKRDPFAALERLGLSYDDLTRRVIAGDARKPTESEEVARLRAEIESRERAREERDRAEKESAAARAREEHARSVAQAKVAMATYVRQNEAKYPLTGDYSDEAIGEAALRVFEMHREQGRVLARDEILGYIEGELEQQLARLQQRKNRANPAPDSSQPTPPARASEQSTGKKAPQASKPPATLTNQLSTERSGSSAEITDFKAWAKQLDAESVKVLKTLRAK